MSGEKDTSAAYQFSKDYLDLVRASLNTFTWVALSAGVVFLAWRNYELKSEEGELLLWGLVVLAAVITSLVAIWALKTYAMELFHRTMGDLPFIPKLLIALVMPIAVIGFAIGGVTLLFIPLLRSALI